MTRAGQLSWYYMKRANPTRAAIFCIEIGSNAHEQCVTHCPVPLLVHLPGHPANMITWNISTWDPSITTLGSQLTKLAWFSYNRNFDFCCAYLTCRDLFIASQFGPCNQALSSIGIARLYALLLDLTNFSQNFSPRPPPPSIFLLPSLYSLHTNIIKNK